VTTLTVHQVGIAFELRAKGRTLSYEELRAVLPRNLLPDPMTGRYSMGSLAHDAAFTYERRSAA
jgi:hypothetical protein